MLALAALGASGCVVFGPFETRPPMSGQLVTATDGKAVAGAEVVVDTYTWVHDKVGSKATRTDADGRWSVPRRLEWQFALMGVPEGPFWAQEVTFRSGDRVSTFAGFDLDHRKDSGVVTGDAWQPRFDARRRNEGPRVLPVFGVMGGRSQILCAYGGGMLFLSYWPVRLALRGEAELGIKGAAAFAGLALGAPTGTENLLNFDVGARLFRRWDGTSAGGAALGPEFAFELLSVRVAFSWVRGLAPDASGREVWTQQVLVGLGYR